jgi:hypothetical protein
MRDILINSMIGFIGSKSLNVFGKKDYGDLVIFVTVLYVGASVILKVGGWYDGLMDSKFMILLEKIFG